MKQCPKCQANISDTAKFCMECGCNIKKYEDEHAQPKARFCPECGTEIPKGAFCPECGYNIGNNLNSEATSVTDAFGDDWLSDLEGSTNADVVTMKTKKSKEQMEKAFAAFEYEEHTDGTYTIIALKDKHALSITVPEGVVAIADHSFEECNAIKITLPNTILQIGNCAFKGCQNLTDINLSNSLMLVGDEAFAECEMLDIDLPVSIRRVGRDAIKNTVRDKTKRTKAEVKRKEAEPCKVELVKKNIGDAPIFGSYYQSGSGKEPIEWIILKKEGSKALLISKFSLDCRLYHTERISTNWENSDLRKWLNNEFLKEAFTDAEQQNIENTKNNTDGIITTDKIFLLNSHEAILYFASDDTRKCAPTAYAVSHGACKTDNRCAWWLRSAGRMRGIAAYVNRGGSACEYGCDVSTKKVGVRPAMWVDISNL